MLALSHSRLNTYNQCPRKFKLQFLDKVFPMEDAKKSPHLVRGDNVHKALESYVVKRRAGQTDIPPSSLEEVERSKPIVEGLIQQFDEVLPEAQVAVDKEWKQVEWFSKKAYYRAIMDIIALARAQKRVMVGDWKTGKINDYSGYGGQLHLTAAIAFAVFPDVEEIDTAYLYVDHKHVKRIKFFRQAEFEPLKAHFDKESEKVNSDTEFKPTPNEFCKWCDATQKQCPYSRKI